MTRRAEVCVVEANGLAEGDLGFLDDHSDPFVRLTLGSRTFTSPIVMDSLSPRWDFCVEVEDGAAAAAADATVEIVDHDQFSAHDVLGRVALPLALGVDSDSLIALAPAGQVRLVVRARPPPPPPPSPPSPRPSPSPPPPPSPAVSPSASPQSPSPPQPADSSTLEPAVVRQAAAADPLLAPTSELSARARGGDGLQVGMAALLLVVGAALVVLGRLWGKGKLRRTSTQLLDRSAARADGDVEFGPTSRGVGQPVIELVQAVQLADVADEGGDAPPRYDSAVHARHGSGKV